VTVANERGTRVYPCPWGDGRAHALATERGAVVAVGRLEAAREGAATAPSLSPAALLELDAVDRLVLPSPNGSALAAALADGGSTVAVGCLRNAGAVARWLAGELDAGRSVAVVAAGERWRRDGSLRPAIEDHLGAGAILNHLRVCGQDRGLSPEARAAAALFEVSAGDLTRTLRDCVGGRELRTAGFGRDVDVAAALDSSMVVPVLDPEDGAFVPLRDRR
jgi:2-phosphosulfolactate phosphatase